MMVKEKRLQYLYCSLYGHGSFVARFLAMCLPAIHPPSQDHIMGSLFYL